MKNPKERHGTLPHRANASPKQIVCNMRSQRQKTKQRSHEREKCWTSSREPGKTGWGPAATEGTATSGSTPRCEGGPKLAADWVGICTQRQAHSNALCFLCVSSLLANKVYARKHVSYYHTCTTLLTPKKAETLERT